MQGRTVMKKKDANAIRALVLRFGGNERTAKRLFNQIPWNEKAAARRDLYLRSGIDRIK